MRLLQSALGGILCLSLAPCAAWSDILYAVGSGVGDSSSNLYRIDGYSTSPTAVNIGETGHTLFDLAIDPTTNRFYAIDDIRQLFELDPLNAQATLIGNTGISGSQNALAFDSGGQLYSWGRTNSNLHRLDKTNAAATPVGSTGYFAAGALAFDAVGQLYGSTTSFELIRIDSANGSATLVGSLGISGYGLAVDFSGTLYLGEGGNESDLARIWTVNTSTGMPTLVGDVSGASQFGLSGLAIQVPEPATLGPLAIASGIAMMLYRRRRTTRSA